MIVIVRYNRLQVSQIAIHITLTILDGADDGHWLGWLLVAVQSSHHFHFVSVDILLLHMNSKHQCRFHDMQLHCCKLRHSIYRMKRETVLHIVWVGELLVRMSDK